MKSIILKPWPELSGDRALLGRIERSGKNNNPLYIDFSSCKEISSTGLTIFLLKILEFRQNDQKKRKYNSNQFHENTLLKDIKQLSFFHHLNQNLDVFGLFTNELKSNKNFKALSHTSYSHRHLVSLPIICLNLSKYNREDRREARFEFRKMIMEEFTKHTEDYSFHITQIATILTEMLKNSADHTECEAYFGVDFIKIPESNSLKIDFVFGDTGAGIINNVKNNSSLDNFRSELTSHMAFTDAYHLALQNGFTTRPKNIHNKGIGMSLIREGGMKIGMDLSVYDAFSRGQLTSIDTISHKNLRKNFFNYTRGQSKPFFYFGSIIGERK